MKNILLMFLGILIALVSLEVLLQTSSFVIAQANKLSNKKIVKLADNKDLIKILCIGESTTVAQYPKQLVDYLNKHITKDFMVIDCGISATHIENIVERIDSQLETYKPNIVISMMGINDAEFQNTEIHKKYKLKILELFMLIKKHIEQIAADQLYADDKDIDYSKLQDEYSANRKELTQLEQLIDKNPKNLKAIETISILYRMRKDYVNVEKYVGIYRANSAAPNMHMLFMLTDAYIRMGKDNDAQKLILSVLNDNDISDEDKNIYLSKAVESYIYLSNPEKLKDYYNLIIKTKTQTAILDNLYKYLISKNISIKYYDYSNKFKNTIKTVNLNTEKIKNAYLIFAKKVIDSGAVYICMGYPAMPIKDFEDFFKDTALKSKILFVSNENNFKEQLKKTPYYGLFRDNFGGAFGHCTDAGNRLIAENVGQYILKIVN